MKLNKKSFVRIVSVFLLLILFLAGCADGNEEEKNAALPAGSNTTNTKKVALTFDDGPHNVYTKKIVDELSKYGAHATFFVVGSRLDGTDYNGKAGMEYAVSAGNEIGIHGYTHKKYYDTCSEEDYRSELSKTLQAIRKISPDTPVTQMRPVGGRITDARAENCDYAILLWNVDSEDWKHKYSSSADESTKEENLAVIVDNVMSTVSDGSIILMHDIYASTYDATVAILERLYAEGYEVVTVSELLGEDLTNGVKYYSKKSRS